MIRRNWDDAVEAHAGEGCRVCGRFPRELMHVLPRAFDVLPGAKARVVRVDPLAVVPGCKPCHWAYDEHRLDLLPYLTAGEVDHAIDRVGPGEALRRIRGRQWLEAA